jgi:hypothetical protein
MIDVAELPHELQEAIWAEYRTGVCARRAEYVRRTAGLDSIRTLCQSDADFDRVLDWMAHMLQYPNVKPQRGIVLVGPPCCGKSRFADLVAQLLGQNNVLRSNTLRNRFNELLDGMTLVTLDGCNVSEEIAHINSLISDQAITIRRPYQGAVVIPSFHRVLVTVNLLSPLLYHSILFQQRFTVIQCGTVNHQEFHEAMHDPVKMSCFRECLMQRQIDANGL